MTLAIVTASFALWQSKSHEFVYTAEADLKSVHVAGSFNNWNKDANPMARDGRTWSLKLDLPAGKHQYKFVLDGETWITDPKAFKNEEDGNGNTNSVVLVTPAGYEDPAKVGDGEITTSAVTHPRDVPALNWDNGKLYLTVKTRSDDVKDVHVLASYSARSASPTRIAMSKSGGDEFTSNWTATLNWDRKAPMRYSFSLDDGGRGPLTFDAAGAWYSRGDTGDRRFILDPKSFRPMTVPSWVERSIVYQIFPDRFANGDPSNDPEGTVPWDGNPEYFNWFGGDFAGVKQRLGHLEGLGVGCVYFNPVFEGPSNHRYEATDYKKVDHRLGTNAQFADLTRHMDSKGIRTVLDGVFNHTAVDFFAFADIVKNQQESKFLDWYYVKSFPVAAVDPPPYEAWFGFKSMPKLNTGTPAARDYLLSVPDFWAKNASIAGWRLDVANEVPAEYWRLFRRRVKANNKENWIVGEIWGDGSPWLKGDQFDSVMNYQFRGSVLGFVAQGSTKPTQYWNSLMRTYDSYGPQVSRNMMNLLGSHDTPRILNECGKNAQLARLAAMLQFTWVGAPCVYYGDELGMAGDRDPDNRRGMDWKSANGSNPFLTLYQALSQLRNGSRALQSGEPKLIGTDDSKGMLVFRRQIGDQWAIVAVNRSPQRQDVVLSTHEPRLNVKSFANDAEKTSVTTTKVRPENGRVSFAVAPLSVSVVQNSGSATP